MINYKQITKELIVFGIVGLSGTILHMVVTYTLTEYMHLWYIVSVSLAQIIAIINNFYWNRTKTFKIKDGHISREFIKSLMVYFVLWLVLVASLYLFTDIVGLWYMYSLGMAVVPIAILNFLGHKYLVFK